MAANEGVETENKEAPNSASAVVVPSELDNPDSRRERAAEVKDRIRVKFSREKEGGEGHKPGHFPNPFTYDSKLWTVRQTILVLFGIVVVPIRIFIFCIILCMAWVFMKLSIMGDFDSSKPMKGWRRWVQYPIAYLVRIMLFAMGFYWVETVGKPCKSKDARLVVCAPHSTIFDTFYIIYAYSYPSTISKIENLQYPLASANFRAMQALAVDRSSRTAKDEAIETLKERARDVNQRHLMIFPEGTCTNRKALITFKRGAFVPGEPVQPVCLEWPPIGFDLSWTAAGPSRLSLALHALCQPSIRLKVTFLPVYYPNEEEKANSTLFANNVRALMAKTLGIPCTNHSYEDMFLAKEAKKLRIPVDHNIPFELRELSALFNINLDDAKVLLRRYSAIYKNSELINGPGLAKILGIPYTAPVKELFDLLKDDEKAGIDFQQLLIGITQLSRALNQGDLEQSIDLVWEAVAGDQTQITEKELFSKLSNVFKGFTKSYAKKLFRTADNTNSGKIDSAAFKQFIRERPELLFVSLETIAQRPKGRRLSVLADPRTATSSQKPDVSSQAINVVVPQDA